MRNIEMKFVAGALLLLSGGCLPPGAKVTPPGPSSDAAGLADAGNGGSDAALTDGGAPPDMTPLFEAAPPSSYVGKVKDILIGMPATDADVAAVVADSSALGGLIDAWVASPFFQERALDFFRNAFQQNSVNMDMLWANNGQGANFQMNNSYRARFERTIMDSFAMTVWQLVQSGSSLADALTTDTYMLTTAQLAVLSYLDEMNANDVDAITDRLAARNAITAAITFDPASTATFAESIDPANANYMIWPNIETATATCAPAKTTIPATTATKYVTLFRYLFGFGTCPNIGPSKATFPTLQVTFAPQLTDADFTDWHMVKIVPTSTGTPNTTPMFWNLPAMRSATSMTLHTPRVGFSGTLAFSANWGTNIGNEARVTANQMLIVGIGQSINGSGALVKFPVNTTDAAHATDPACTGCHGQLDPMKQFIRQSWSLEYHDQTDTSQLAIPANFNIDGVTASGTGIGDLTHILATHPRFALAWTIKLYFWATSRAADETDPEIIRIANVFQQSGFNFKALVHELFSSPLVTYGSATQTTTASGDTLSTARRDQFCTALSNRLGLADACGQLAAAPSASQAAIARIATLIAADTYYRAFELPALPTMPDLFFRSSVEAVCGQIAGLVVDAGASTKYKSVDPTPAIADMVSNVMGLPPSDARSAPALQILTDHFTTAKATTGVTATQALVSTFQLACLSPSSVIVGL